MRFFFLSVYNLNKYEAMQRFKLTPCTQTKDGQDKKNMPRLFDLETHKYGPDSSIGCSKPL